MANDDADLHERFEQHLIISADPGVVFDCFFNPAALRAWWQTTRSVTTPVPLGVYAIEWPRTPYRDDLLGTLGGVFHGTVVDVRPGETFLVADAYWIPPEGDPIGPMALQIDCAKDPGRLPSARPPGRLRGLAALAPLLRGGVARLADFADGAQALRGDGTNRRSRPASASARQSFSTLT